MNMQNKINELISKGITAQNEGNFVTALQYFQQAYDLALQIGDSMMVERIASLIDSARQIIELQEQRERSQLASKTEEDIGGIGMDETTLDRISLLLKQSTSVMTEIVGGRGGGDESIEEIDDRKREDKASEEARPTESRAPRPPAYIPPPSIPPSSAPASPAPKPAPVGDLKQPPKKPPTGPPAPPSTTQPSTGAGLPRPPPPAAGKPPAASIPRQEAAREKKESIISDDLEEFPAPAEGEAEPDGLSGVPPAREITTTPEAPLERAPKAIEKEKDRPEKQKAKKGRRRGAPSEIIDEDEDEEKEDQGERPSAPKKIKRFGDVAAPMEMTEKKEYLVNIGLRMFKEDVVGTPVPMEITVPKVGPPIIEIFVHGRDFKVDQARRTLVVPLDRDSDILNFRVTPTNRGIQNLTVEFYQEGMLIGRAILKIIVKKKKEEVNEALSSTSVTVASQFHDSRLDATLRIVRYGEDFFFSLFTPRAKAVVSQNALFGKTNVNISKLRKLEAQMEDAIMDFDHPWEALDRLKVLGAQIFGYIPKQIQKSIETIAPKYLMIETGDLLVPWELAYDGDDFLSIKYCLGKRVFDETKDFRPPPFCIGKQILDVVFIGASPSGWPEIAVNDELELFDTFNKSKRITLNKLVEPDARKVQVLSLLNKGDMVHLTCHGKFEQDNPLESALMLSDEALTAAEIDDIDMNWPLIFANACSTGAISDKIVGIGGIARAFLEAGAIAFLGPLFEIPDDIAVEFAKEFYSNILYNNENLGEAILNTRKMLRDKFGGAFWAIFSLYGDPTLQVCKA